MIEAPHKREPLAREDCMTGLEPFVQDAKHEQLIHQRINTNINALISHDVRIDVLWH